MLKIIVKDNEDLKYKIVNRMKVWRYAKKYCGMSYKDKVKSPLKKTTKSHHRLRTTWIIQFLTYSHK